MAPERTRAVPDGYPHGPAAATDGLMAALARTPNPAVMILVEGVSDQIAVETLAVALGLDLGAEGIAVVPIGGAGAVRRVVTEHAGPGRRLLALCDAAEEAQVRRSIDASGRVVEVAVCDPDLEGELIRALGLDRALAVLDEGGDRAAFTSLQRQVAWRGRPATDQLRRFIGAGARRKLRYARLLTAAAVEVGRVPSPLTAVLAGARSG